MLCPGGQHLVEDEIGPDGTPLPVHHDSAVPPQGMASPTVLPGSPTTYDSNSAPLSYITGENASFDALHVDAPSPAGTR